MLEERQRRIAEFIASFRVKPGATVKLAKDFDPGHKATFIKKKDGVKLLQEGVELLAEYQSRLAAQDTWGVLVCLQALDAAGKDGTIRHVMSGVNPQGVSVHSFNVPSAEELDHGYLWRYAKRLPRRGVIGSFNRSHYEEVLVVRVHPKNLERQRLPKQARGEDVWEHRDRDINAWERHLARNGFKVVKLLLNISREEQRRRFLARIDEPDKNWKFSANDARKRFTGMTTRPPSLRCSPTQARNGRPGTSSRRTTSGSRASACLRFSPTRWSNSTRSIRPSALPRARDCRSAGPAHGGGARMNGSGPEPSDR